MEKYRLSQAQIEDALAEQNETGERLGEILVKRGIISRIDLAGALSTQWNFQSANGPGAEAAGNGARPPLAAVPVPVPQPAQTVAPPPVAPPSAHQPAPEVETELARRDARLEQHERAMLELQTRLRELREELAMGAGRLKACEAVAEELSQTCAALGARVEAQSQEIEELRRAAGEQSTRLTSAARALLD